MSESEIFAKIKEIIKPYCKNEEALANATNETTFLKDLEINSARLVDIVIDFEDAYDIEVADEEADKILSMGDAVKLIADKTA